jgi:hypothetical protein
VPLQEARTDGDGNPVHSSCEAMRIASQYTSVSPMVLICPRCHVPAGIACEVLADGDAGMLELIHLERIEWARSMDGTVRGF